jgi:parvulin-like peptidyl-prolyl isomerase
MNWQAVVWAVVVAGFGAAPIQADIVDEVVATVDTEAILRSDVIAEVSPALNDLRQTAVSDTAFQRTLDVKIRETLDQHIEAMILYREAQLAGLEVDEDVIDRELERLRALYDSNEEFLQDLEDAGETVGDLRLRLRKQVLARAMAARKLREFEADVAVSESEVAQYFQDHQDEFQRPERARCRQVFLPVEPDGPNAEIVRARLEEVQDELANGASFAELAEAFSKAAGAADGGNLGWVERGDYVKPIEDAVFATDEGDVTGIVQSQYGYHILLVEEKQEEGLAALEDVRKEIEPELRARAASVKYQKWIAELRKRSRVRVFI